MSPTQLFVTLLLALTSVTNGVMLDMTRTFDNSSRKYPSVHSPFILRTLLKGIQPGGFWLQFEDVESGIHVGTHMDAPRHFCESCWSIDQVPLDHLVGRPVVMIDIRQKAAQNPDTDLTLEDVKEYEKVYGEIPRGAVVIQCSGWADKYDDAIAYLGNDREDKTDFHWPAYRLDATQFLVDERGIYGLGVDSLSIDSGNAVGYPTHRYYSARNVFSLENVDNTCQLPPAGATITVMPEKVGGASGGHVRVFAMWDTDTTSSAARATTGILATLLALTSAMLLVA